MEFGKLANVNAVDWSLPGTNPRSRDWLPGGSQRLELRLGTPAWGHPEWIGKIYPPKTPASRFLWHYSRAYQTVEFNTTHYRIPTTAQIEKWCSPTPDDFQFCPKIFQGISHSPGGLQDLSLLKAWTESLNAYGAKRGPCFMQLPPHFDYSRKAELFAFLKAWPDEFELALEFRHPSWFTPDRQILPALGDYLSSRGMGLVILDAAGRRDLLHASLTTSFSVLRWIGNSLHPSDSLRSKAWAQRLLDWQGLGLQRMYYFIHQPDDVLAPEMTDLVIADLNEALGDVLPPLSKVSTPPQPLSLFDATEQGPGIATSES